MENIIHNALHHKILQLQDRLLRIAIKHGFDAETAADLVQDLWLFVLERAKKLRQEPSKRAEAETPSIRASTSSVLAELKPGPGLRCSADASQRQKMRPIGILIGQILNQRRFNKRHPSCAGSEMDEESLQAEEMAQLGFASARLGNPEEALFQKEKLEQLSLAVSQLPLSQQNAIWQRFGEDLTLREMAQVLSDSLSGSRRQVQAALLRLREELAPLAPDGSLSAQDLDSEEE